MHDPLFPMPDGQNPPSGLLPDLPARPRRRLLVAGAGATAVVALLAVVTTDLSRPAPPHAAASVAPSPHLLGTGRVSLETSTTADSARTDPVSFVRSYYAELPVDRATAWTDYDDYYRNRTGRAAFDEFWSGIASVEVLTATPTDDTTVELTLRYVTRAGLVDTERRWIRVIEQDGRLLIHDSERIGPA